MSSLQPKYSVSVNGLQKANKCNKIIRQILNKIKRIDRHLNQYFSCRPKAILTYITRHDKYGSYCHKPFRGESNQNSRLMEADITDYYYDYCCCYCDHSYYLKFLPAGDLPSLQTFLQDDLGPARQSLKIPGTYLLQTKCPSSHQTNSALRAQPKGHSILQN